MLMQMPKQTRKAPKGPRRSGQPAGKTALVTGASSGIGRALISKLLDRGYAVRILLRRHPTEDREWRDLPKGVEIYVSDITKPDADVMREALGGVNVLFHLAAATRNYGKRFSGERASSDLMINTNVIGTENVLRAYVDANPSGRLRVIYASSIAVYGYDRKGEILTEESETKPKGQYSETKYMAEQVVKAFAAANNRIEYTILRIGLIFGPGYERSFMKIFKLIKEGRIRYIGRGDNHISMVSVDEVVDGIMRAATAERSSNRVYNLTNGVPYTQKSLFSKAARLLSKDEPSRSIHPLLARIGAATKGIDPDEFRLLVSDRIISIDRIRKELGFRPNDDEKQFKELIGEFLKRYDGLVK